MLKHIETSKVAPPFGSYSQAVEIPLGARVLHVAGQVGATPNGVIPDDVESQARLMFENLGLVLEAAGMTLRDVVHVNYYIRYEEDLSIVRRCRDALFIPPYPAASLSIVKALGRPEWRFEIDCVAAKVDEVRP
ncbi:RidA family protein [Simplicispira suum]|uniref:Enamine deaminase RidA n=1 Tax=Simplicispira suum TaxID=2109915 RepID=A0A2S0N326_9BURK|nr:RidA family protein [Simplicispira suum]AVO42554.1 enamine deaminase RidA [Simplicispira suum]